MDIQLEKATFNYYSYVRIIENISVEELPSVNVIVVSCSAIHSKLETANFINWFLRIIWF